MPHASLSALLPGFFYLINVLLLSTPQNIDHSSPEVREAAFQSIGAMLKLVGEAKLHPFIADLDKLKLEKVWCVCDHIDYSFLSQHIFPVRK